MTTAGVLALRTQLRFVGPAPGIGIEVLALRRPEVVLRRTRYDGIVVDERELTRAFAWRAPPERVQAMVVAEGRVVFETFVAGPGDVVVLTPAMAGAARFERTSFVDLEWTRSGGPLPAAPRLCGRAEAKPLFGAFEDEARDDRAFFARAFALLREAGVDLGHLHAARLEGAPSDRDERIARALEAQLRDLGTRADTVAFGELAELSPRQLQRVVDDYCARYGLNAGTWRDMRNRWRIRIAAALSRAFVNAGLPPPSVLRARIGACPS